MIVRGSDGKGILPAKVESLCTRLYTVVSLDL